MVLKRLLGLGSKRLRAITILAAAARAIRDGRLLRGAGLAVASVLAWKYFVVALVIETLLGLIRRDDDENDTSIGTIDREETSNVGQGR